MIKKLLLLLGLGLFLTGCADTNISVDDGVPRNEQGESIVGDSGLNVNSKDYYLSVALGEIDNVSSIHKFGSGTIGTNYQIISSSGVYMVPTSPVSLEFVSSDSEDTYLGIGAREITIEVINSLWEREVITINTSGTTAVPLPIDVLRVTKWYVSSSGSYANPPTSISYQGDLEIRELGNGPTWTQILNSPTTTGQSQIGAYTIPKGKTAYLLSKSIFSDTTKTADIYFFFRDNSDDVTAPYDGARRIIEREVGLSGGYNIDFTVPKGPYVGPAEIGFFGAVSQGNSDVSVEFELLLIDTE